MRSTSGGRRRARNGFSLIELLMAMSIMGILAGLAIPNLRTMTFRARAASVSGDIDVVRVAISQYNADQNAWPAEAANGVVPPELSTHLPEGFSFQGEGFELDYEALSPVVIPGDPSTTQVIGVAVTADTDELSNAIVELLGGGIIFSTGRRHTFVIFRS
ncbi:MAG: type II secretion system protein [Gemmatimonadetes bacterium]|nr:type II secretion system protein [Gemmatimonadota bacterium]NNL31231.1 type II secretion system protein [Gemmatimonadota bacterium]